MRIERGRPIIEPGDYPTTVEAALRHALHQKPRGSDEDQVWRERKALEEARDAVRDGFATLENGEMLKPTGNAPLFLSVAGLQNTLQAYRDGLSPDSDAEKISQADELLAKLENGK